MMRAPLSKRFKRVRREALEQAAGLLLQAAMDADSEKPKFKPEHRDWPDYKILVDRSVTLRRLRCEILDLIDEDPTRYATSTELMRDEWPVREAVEA